VTGREANRSPPSSANLNLRVATPPTSRHRDKYLPLFYPDYVWKYWNKSV